MSVCGHVVMVLYEGPLVFCFTGHHTSSILIPYPFDPFELVRIDPRLYHFFILCVYWVCGFHFFLSQDPSHRGCAFCSSCSYEDAVWQHNHIFVVVFSLIVSWSS